MYTKKALSPKDKFYYLLISPLMKTILDYHIENKNFHHGYLLIGDFKKSSEMAIAAAENILEIREREYLLSHPDFFYKKYELFTIEDSHEIIERASQRPLSGEKKVFILEINGFSTESANALLKTLEEPYEGTYFFILFPALDGILPTLRSRMVVVNMGRGEVFIDEEVRKKGEDFLKSAAQKRMEIIKEFFDDRFQAIEFLNVLEILLAKGEFEKKNKELALSEILRCRPFLFYRGGSSKMVLEHIALALPKMVK